VNYKGSDDEEAPSHMTLIVPQLEAVRSRQASPGGEVEQQVCMAGVCQSAGVSDKYRMSYGDVVQQGRRMGAAGRWASWSRGLAFPASTWNTDGEARLSADADVGRKTHQHWRSDVAQSSRGEDSGCGTDGQGVVKGSIVTGLLGDAGGGELHIPAGQRRFNTQDRRSRVSDGEEAAENGAAAEVRKTNVCSAFAEPLPVVGWGGGGFPLALGGACDGWGRWGQKGRYGSHTCPHCRYR
jgi:hypothetical protein